MNSRLHGQALRRPGRWPVLAAGMLALALGGQGAAAAAPADPGRLFFTPAQRAELETARARTPVLSGPGKPVAGEGAPAPLRYDGVVIRSDGQTTRWIDGKAQLGGSAVSGLKPGQVRADGKVYEPYQILRARPFPPAKEALP